MSFAREVLGERRGQLTRDQVELVVAAKQVIYAGIEEAVEMGVLDAAEAGILIDEGFGEEIAARAKGRGISVAIAVERSGQAVLELEYGEDFGKHLDAVEPDFAKVLVRYNIAGDRPANELQRERLESVAEFVSRREFGLMCELLVPPTDDQLAGCGGDTQRFEDELRAELIVAGIRDLQKHGIEPDVWKIEGVLETAQVSAIAAQARSGPGRERVACLVLGAGASTARVDEWIRVAAATDGYAGFAIGRSIWRDPVRRHLAGELAPAEAARLIAEGFGDFVKRWTAATNKEKSND